MFHFERNKKNNNKKNISSRTLIETRLSFALVELRKAQLVSNAAIRPMRLTPCLLNSEIFFNL